ncbi:MULTISPECIES: NUDIX domain-containing protein [unclassified Streptomyces]|uniref:NUDIX domain-containing protein n=1 Tax=unclassified Streptomyces TaxID=2593676 RepID=UPI001BEC5D9E|nr:MULTISPECIES: NUDIX domain-containing protein [unclassified Streptomyces]MBT2407935.1 NUDIX domain-containing protein [Streptomyces sp. ISL-21]MBT2608615.1 NUDIX domain-containing protein [Streptomyces sp. ISL-87]
MPPTRSHIRELVTSYLKHHPGEQAALANLLGALEAEADPTVRATLPGHVTCSAIVIDQDRRVLHIHHKASGGLVLAPGGHVDAEDRTLLEAALREVHEEAGIPPAALCTTAEFLGAPIDITVHDIEAGPAKGEPAHQHYDFRFVFYLADADVSARIALQTEEVSGAEWRPFDQISSPTLRDKLLASRLDGRVEPVNASALVHDGAGRYLLHLRDNYPDIWEPGAFALLGGGREPGDLSLEDTVRRELAEEVFGLEITDLEPYAVDQATGVDGLAVPIQVFAGRWRGDPDALELREGVLLRWFTPDDLPRLRLSPSTIDLVRQHAAQQIAPGPGPAPATHAAVLNVLGVHLYLEDDEGRVLLGLRHPDSAFAGDTWHFPAGHCAQEPAVACLVRETLEETGLVIDPTDVEYAHAVHLVDSPGAQPRLGLVFRTRRWKGTPEVREPDKCLAWKWWHPEELPEPIVPYTRAAIDGIAAGRLYTELGW